MEKITISEELIRLGPKLRYYALSLTRDRDRAEELLSDLCMRALEQQEKFDVHMVDKNGAMAWLTVMMRNLFISNTRALKNRVLYDRIDLLESKDFYVSPEIRRQLSLRPEVESRIEAAHLMSAFRGLTRKQRHVLVLSVMDDKTQAEIAAMQGTTVGTIKSRMSRARDKMGESMGVERRRP